MNYVLIFAGGTGQRMKSADNTPKQFLKISKKPIIIHTLDNFENCKDIDGIIVVCIKSWINKLRNMLKKFNITKVLDIIPGGETGFESRILGLRHLNNIADKSKENIVLLHDGVRPIITDTIISENIKKVKECGNAITMGRATETISIVNDDSSIKTTLNRDMCRFARAPQSFYLNEILEAYEKAKKDSREDLIDSASVFEYVGKTLYTINGPDENIKITTPLDFFMFKGLVSSVKNKKFNL
ncbi:MAG: 2-C-methyl-D-erythritol 4-phosphate cytidylyltransferase [Clostridia bacterium]|nr:2-C-methyl-D-erythritol 4-phosphate cytidylyltransferase [Clostridia bacterium]